MLSGNTRSSYLGIRVLLLEFFPHYIGEISNVKLFFLIGETAGQTGIDRKLSKKAHNTYTGEKLNMKEISDSSITKITIKSRSGCGPAEEAYCDTLTIRPGKMSYIYKPYCESETNSPRRWSYSTDNPQFMRIYIIICMEAEAILCFENECRMEDVRTYELTATFSDGTKECKVLRGDETGTGILLSLLKMLVPPLEDEPGMMT